MGAIAFLHSKTPRTFLTVRLADMQASSRNALDIHFSTQCVSLKSSLKWARTRVVLIRTLSPILMMERSTWRPMPVISVLYGGTFRSNVMATQSLAIQNGHGNIWVTRMHGCSCRRASVGLESCGSFGLCRLQGANFSAVFCLRFLVQPNLELQQFHCRCYDNVYRGLREHLNEKKDCNFMDCVN